MSDLNLQTLPVIIFMNSVIAAGYYFGAVQAIIASFGRFLAWCLDTTPIESVTAAANIFLGTVSSRDFLKVAMSSKGEHVWRWNKQIANEHK